MIMNKNTRKIYNQQSLYISLSLEFSGSNFECHSNLHMRERELSNPFGRYESLSSI